MPEAVRTVFDEEMSKLAHLEPQSAELNVTQARRAAEIILEITRGTGKRPKQRRIDLGFKLIARDSTGRAS